MQTQQTKSKTQTASEVDQPVKQHRDVEQEELLERSDELLDEIDEVLEDARESELESELQRYLHNAYEEVLVRYWCGC